MSRSDYKTNFIFTDFGQLAFHKKGNQQATKAFIFLHGHINTAFEYGNYHYFENGVESSLHIFLDHRWHGSSTRIENYPTISQRAEDIDLLLTKLVEDYPQLQQVYLVGYSQGGSVLLYYLSSDYKFKHLVTEAFAIAPRLNLKDYLIWLSEGINEMEKNHQDSFQKKYKSKGYFTYTRSYIDEFREIDFFKICTSIDMPVVLIRGDKDELITKEELLKLQSRNQQYLSYLEIKDCSHFPTIEKQHEIYLTITAL